MRIVKLIYVLYKIKLLSPLGLYRLITAVFKNGMNVMTLLHFAEMKYAHHIVLVDDHESITYEQLLTRSNKLAHCLNEKYQLQSGQKVGFLCKNHASLVTSMFAVSRLGADLYFLNAELSKEQLNVLVDRHQFHLLIYDAELIPLIDQSHYEGEKVLSYHQTLPAINNFLLLNINEKRSLPRTSVSRLVLQTSGTTGVSKDVPHTPSLFNYLNPFAAFIKRLKVLNYNAAYIATPIYHGYGLAVLLLFIPLGKKVIITSRFDPKKACRLIDEHQIEVITVVPSMLQKLLQTNTESLKSLACIASGGAKLSTKLVRETFQQLGGVLYNLYGTSEAGLNFIATPEDLTYSPSTVGKKINGMQLSILDEDMKQVEVGRIGKLYIKNDWSMSNSNSSWIATGDLGYCDENSYYFLSGRTDEMIISGGENVYPIEVEQVLMTHPLIEDAAVIGISDEPFGQRLKAFILPVKNNSLTEELVLEWLRPRVARFQIPKEVELVDHLPYTPLGKLDKKQLQ